MLAENHIAFKEWAVICAALGTGRQSLILRKGGIHEGPQGFQLDHREFWLYPTQFHQQPTVLVPEAADLWDQVRAEVPPTGQIALLRFVVVEELLWLETEAAVARLNGWHLWSAETVLQRFHYRQPGLWACWVRTYQLPEPHFIAEEPRFAGCKSWVELTAPLSTSNLQSVLSDAEHLRNTERRRVELPLGIPQAS